MAWGWQHDAVIRLLAFHYRATVGDAGWFRFWSYWGLSTFTDEELDPEIIEKEYVFFLSALMVIGSVLVVGALGLEG